MTGTPRDSFRRARILAGNRLIVFRSPIGPPTRTPLMSKRLFVSNLAPTTTKATLQELFAREGRHVETIQLVMTRRYGLSRGFAFVEMGTDSDGEATMRALDGALVDGRPVRLAVATPRKSRFDH